MSTSPNPNLDAKINADLAWLAGAAPAARAITFFESIAQPLIERGWKVAPCYPKDKKVHTALVPNPLNQRSDQSAQITEWGASEPSANVCVYAVQEEDGLCLLDKDALRDIRKAYNEETGKDFDTLFVESSPNRGHWYFLQTPKTRALAANISEKKTNGWFSFRVKNEYVCSVGSIHPKTGQPYKIVSDVPPIPIPDELVDWLYKQTRTPAKKKNAPSLGQKTPIGQRYTALISEVGLLWSRGYSRETVISAGLDWARSNFQLDAEFDAAMVRKEIEAIPNTYAPGAPAIVFKAKPPADLCSTSGPSPTIVEVNEDTLAVPDDVDITAKVPIKHVDPLWPRLSEDALYGLAGDIVRKIIPETEAHPAGLLVQTLMYFGNIIGRTAYIQQEATRHYCNLFAVRLGASSKGRKGTAGDWIDSVYKSVDPVWFATRLRSGLSSGEGLIVAVQDEVRELNKRGEMVIAEGGAGVADKRVLSYESEFAQVLSVIQRQGATITTNLRNAWDGKPLRTMTIKPRCATGHLVSVLGDTTKFDLRMMNQQDANNGFANRFLWVFVYRENYLVFGGTEVDFGPEIDRMREAIDFAKTRDRMFMDKAAREMWYRAYLRLSVEQDGLFGSVISRSEPQVLRLALIYALLDCSTHIRSEHLHAALAFWQYCEDSARHIFEGETEEQKQILEHLRTYTTGQTITAIHGVFGRNRKAELVRADLEALMRRKLIRTEANKSGVDEYFVIRKKHVVLG